MTNTENKSHNRAIIIVTAIVALIFVNAGIFYTSRIARKANEITTANQGTVPTTAKLNSQTLQALQSRTPVSVEDKLKSNTSGRTNPFITP